MQRRNAPLTPNGRRRLVALVEEEGFTLQAAARRSLTRSRKALGLQGQAPRARALDRGTGIEL